MKHLAEAEIKAVKASQDKGIITLVLWSRTMGYAFTRCGCSGLPILLVKVSNCSSELQGFLVSQSIFGNGDLLKGARAPADSSYLISPISIP